MQDLISLLSAPPLIFPSHQLPAPLRWTSWPDPWLHPRTAKALLEHNAALPPPDSTGSGASNPFAGPHNRGFRLGRYVEQGLTWIAKNILQAEIIASQQRVQREEQGVFRDIGEIDLIYRTDSTIIHREIAYKIYLWDPNFIPPEATNTPIGGWMGLQRRDRLAQKSGHMIEHQGPLAHTPEAFATLATPPDFTELWLRGQLFLPYPKKPYPKPIPPKVFAKSKPLRAQESGLELPIDSRAIRGYWCESHTWQSHFAPRGQWWSLPKSRWLTRLHPEPTPDPNPQSVVALTPNDRPGEPYPQLCARCVPSPSGLWEVERVVVVPDNWAAKARG